jgi:hypothetical protein
MISDDELIGMIRNAATEQLPIAVMTVKEMRQFAQKVAMDCILRQQYRALERIQKQITELENKIEYELAKAQQRTGAYDRGSGVEFA